MKITRIVEKTCSKVFNTSEAGPFIVQCTGRDCSVLYRGNVIAEFRGDVSEFCFKISNYLICLEREDIVGVLGECTSQS